MLAPSTKTTTTDFEFGVKDSDLVVEAATENVDLKLNFWAGTHNS